MLPKELLESGGELAAEDAAQCADRQEDASGRSELSGAIGSETAGRNNDRAVWSDLRQPAVSLAFDPRSRSTHGLRDFLQCHHSRVAGGRHCQSPMRGPAFNGPLRPLSAQESVDQSGGE